jgi:hypothetical protein
MLLVLRDSAENSFSCIAETKSNKQVLRQSDEGSGLTNVRSRNRCKAI